MRALAAALILIACAPGIGYAHKPSDSYLTLEADGRAVRGQWDIALRDLEHAIGLDANGDGTITWGELRARHAEIAAYALARLQVSVDGRRCVLAPHEHLVDTHSDGAYEVLRFRADCGDIAYTSLEAGYALFFELDPTHRGLLQVRLPGGATSAVLSPERPRFAVSLEGASRVAQFLDYGREGVWHIWIGLDHVLFIVSLLLPAVLALTRAGWVPVARFAPAFWDVFKVVSAFTVAHSITLSLAALGVLELPSRPVEAAIALSVVLAALNNLWPVVHARRWVVAFAFGLVHGFGFASVLADLGLPRGTLLLALIGFNLGVELGQLAIVSIVLPLAFILRRTWTYRRIILGGGSAAVALIAALWLVERAFNVRLLAA